MGWLKNFSVGFFQDGRKEVGKGWKKGLIKQTAVAPTDFFPVLNVEVKFSPISQWLVFFHQFVYQSGAAPFSTVSLVKNAGVL